MFIRRLSQTRTRKVASTLRAPRVETLEIRRVLDAQTGAAGDLAVDNFTSCEAIDADQVLAAVEFRAAEADSSEAGFTRFQSAEELQDYLIQDALRRWKNLFGQSRAGYPYWPELYRQPVLFLEGTANFAMADVGLLASQTDFSQTNLQVAGVDEADYVKTDGDYLYIVSQGELVIVDARSPEQLETVSRIELEGAPFAHYLSDDRLTILSRMEKDQQPITGVTVLDVSDRSSPLLLQHTELEGRYVESRAIGKTVYLVVESNFFLPAPELIPLEGTTETAEKPGPLDYSVYGDVFIDPWREPTQRYETEQEYLARIQDQVLELALPQRSTYSATGELLETKLLSQADKIFHPAMPDAHTLVSIVSFDVSDTSQPPPSAVSVPANSNSKVYVSASSIYLLQNSLEGALPWGVFPIDWWTPSPEATAILKFDIAGDAGISFAAVGQVSGRILNQFSVDESQGFLRIATTTGWGPESSNHVFVLEQQEQALTIVGSLEDLAPGERLYSARFLGDRGFLVTFVQVDPLFALDLSDPTNPRVEGELKVPGFSNYLQPVDANHLIGIGRNADPATGLFQELQVSLFDVSDLQNPMLVDRYSMEGGRETWSDATTDHHAVGFFAESGILAIPIFGQSWWASSQLEQASSSVMVFQLDVDQGIELLGRIDHDSRVNRSVRIDDVLLTISEEAIRANSLFAPETAYGEINYLEADVDVPQAMWHNERNSFDVNNDGIVSPADMLFVINDLNAKKSVRLGVTKLRLRRDAEFAERLAVETTTLAAAENVRDGANFVDVNRDGRRDLLDLLNLVNRLNEEHWRDAVL